MISCRAQRVKGQVQTISRSSAKSVCRGTGRSTVWETPRALVAEPRSPSMRNRLTDQSCRQIAGACPWPYCPGCCWPHCVTWGESFSSSFCLFRAKSSAHASSAFRLSVSSQETRECRPIWMQLSVHCLVAELKKPWKGRHERWFGL